MWKVVLIVCALGNPCVLMEEDPKKFYSTKSECMANASAKHSQIVEAYADYGYHVENSQFMCELMPGLTNS